MILFKNGISCWISWRDSCVERIQLILCSCECQSWSIIVWKYWMWSGFLNSSESSVDGEPPNQTLGEERGQQRHQVCFSFFSSGRMFFSFFWMELWINRCIVGFEISDWTKSDISDWLNWTVICFQEVFLERVILYTVNLVLLGLIHCDGNRWL